MIIIAFLTGNKKKYLDSIFEGRYDFNLVLKRNLIVNSGYIPVMFALIESFRGFKAKAYRFIHSPRNMNNTIWSYIYYGQNVLNSAFL